MMERVLFVGTVYTDGFNEFAVLESDEEKGRRVMFLDTFNVHYEEWGGWEDQHWDIVADTIGDWYDMREAG